LQEFDAVRRATGSAAMKIAELFDVRDVATIVTGGASGVFITNRAAVPHLKARGVGRIVVTTSTAATTTTGGRNALHGEQGRNRTSRSTTERRTRAVQHPGQCDSARSFLTRITTPDLLRAGFAHASRWTDGGN
jgi:NADP-dependent 3-hydroxy acid dehydrogenase YdfG